MRSGTSHYRAMSFLGLALLVSVGVNFVLLSLGHPPATMWLPFRGSDKEYIAEEVRLTPGGARADLEFMSGLDYEYEYRLQRNLINRLWDLVRGRSAAPEVLVYVRYWPTPPISDAEGKEWGLFVRLYTR